jgi:hypothetical protein
MKYQNPVLVEFRITPIMWHKNLECKKYKSFLSQRYPRTPNTSNVNFLSPTENMLLKSSKTHEEVIQHE